MLTGVWGFQVARGILAPWRSDGFGISLSGEALRGLEGIKARRPAVTSVLSFGDSISAGPEIADFCQSVSNRTLLP
jgi:hypothetical protein